MIFVASCCYILDKNNDNSPPKNKLWCSNIRYYDTSSNNFNYKYKPSVFSGDSLVNFTSPNDKIHSQKDFINDEQITNTDSLEYYDVTLKDGSRYIITQISEDGCKIKSIEDSLQNDLRSSSDNDDDENNN